jgi:hypothetical protein
LLRRGRLERPTLTLLCYRWGGLCYSESCYKLLLPLLPLLTSSTLLYSGAVASASDMLPGSFWHIAPARRLCERS